MEENKESCMGWCAGMKCHGHKRWLSFVVAFLLVFLLIKTVGNKNDNVQKDTIVVNGKSELTIKPDMATISFSVTQENMDISKASDLVNKNIEKILENLKTNGVLEKDIKTTSYNIYPRYDYIDDKTSPYGGKQVLAGYSVTQSVVLKIRDLSKAGRIVSDLGGLGVTDMSGLSFTNDNYDELLRQVRDEAITDARKEAEKLAKALGVRLKKIIGYSEGGTYPIYYGRAAAMGMGGDVSMSKEAYLPTGENTITSNVSVTYEIR